MPKRHLFLDFERKRCRVPPHDRWPDRPSVDAGQAGPSPWQGDASRAPVDHAVLAEGRAARCPSGVPARVVRRVEHRVEHLEPAFDRLIAANRRDQEVTRAGRRDIGNPDRLGLIALQLLVGSFQKLDRRRSRRAAPAKDGDPG